MHDISIYPCEWFCFPQLVLYLFVTPFYLFYSFSLKSLKSVSVLLVMSPRKCKPSNWIEFLSFLSVHPGPSLWSCPNNVFISIKVYAILLTLIPQYWYKNSVELKLKKGKIKAKIPFLTLYPNIPSQLFH